MLIYTQRINTIGSVSELPEIALNHEQRRKARMRIVLSDGTAIGVELPRATVLQAGDVLSTDTRQLIVVRAAPEHVSVVTSPDQTLLTRVAYHLGNRHAPLQIGDNCIVFLHEPVLNQLCERFGLNVSQQWRDFEPEMLGQHQHV